MINLFEKMFYNNTMRKKLIMYFMLTTFFMALTSLYTYYNAHMLMLKMNTMFQSNVYLDDLRDNVNKVQQSLESYLSTKHSDSLMNYQRSSSLLRSNTEKLQKDISNDTSGLMLQDIEKMTDTYLQETDIAVNSKRGRDIYEYMSHYNEASKVFGYINLYINRLNEEQFQENTARYLVVAARLNFIQYLNIGIIIGVVIFNIILIFWITYKITKPIISLSHSADEISRGNFDVKQVSVDTNDEIRVMSDAFNRMSSSIKIYINEIKEKAELESRLKEQEMQNLKMKNILKEAELQALQSQINPHFLFNTLNAGAQVAMLEGADRTCTFIENVANLFRYNIKKLDRPVTLNEEINNIETYIFILKARFGDRIKFIKEVDKSVVDFVMPCMILQPIVENAFIHGIGDMESGGVISLIVEKADAAIKIIIRDNGKGMDTDQVNKILNYDSSFNLVQEHKSSGHTTGIGLQNVISRLKLFYDKEHILDIYSKEGIGTDFIIRIPFGAS